MDLNFSNLEKQGEDKDETRFFVVLLLLIQDRPFLNQETAIPDQENRLVGAYYNLDTYQSTLTFNHKGSRPLEMFVTLFNTTGERLNLEPIRVAEASHLTVDLRGLVSNRRRRFSEGSLEIRHYGKPLEVGARTELLNRQASLLFDEQLQMPFDSEIMRELSELPHGISDIQSAGVELRYSSRPGSVVAMAHSVSERKNHVFRVPLIDPATLPSSAGGYPWRVERGVTTVFHVKNVSSKRQTHSWQLDFDGGVYASGLKVVGPGDTRTIDIRELLVRQIPDIHGNVIPLRAGSGQIRWSAHSTGRAGLIARTEEVDMLTGVNSTYSCLNCCPDSYLDSYLLPSSDDGPISDTSQFTAFQINENCYGTTGAAIVPSNVRWRSSNTGTATVNSSGLATHKYPGSASIEGEWQVSTWEPLFESQICSLSLRFTAETAQMIVRPTVSISPNYTRIPLDRTRQSEVVTSVQLTGGGYPSSGRYHWTTASNKVTLSNTGSQVGTVHSAGASTSQNDVTVKLTYTLNGQSATATQKLTVVKPASLTVSSTSKGSYDCSMFGLDCSSYRRDIAYKVKDQFNHTFPRWNIWIKEAFSGVTSSCSGVLRPTNPTNRRYSDSGFTDTFVLCTPSCPQCGSGNGCAVSFTQKWYVNGFPVQSKRVTLNCTDATLQ